LASHLAAPDSIESARRDRSGDVDRRRIRDRLFRSAYELTVAGFSASAELVRHLHQMC